MTSSASNDLRWRLGNLAAMLLLAAAIAWTVYLHFGPLSLHVGGRLVEQGTGAPIEGAWVMLALTGSGTRSFWQSHGGCMSDSAVIRTDRDGRFRYTAEISAEERSPSQGFTIFAYHPVFTAAIRDDVLDGASESLKQRIATQGYEGLPDRTYLTLPRDYEEDDGEVVIKMSRRENTEWEALQRTISDSNLACLGLGFNNGHKEFYEELYRRGLAAVCTEKPIGGAEGFPLRDLIGYLESKLSDIAQAENSSIGYSEMSEQSRRRVDYIRMRLVPNYRWDLIYGNSRKDPSLEEQRIICGFYSQPIDHLIEMEFPL